MIPYILAVAIGILVGIVDSNSTEIQPTLLALGVLVGLLTWRYRTMPWPRTLIVCVMIPIVHLALRLLGMNEVAPPEPNVFATLVSIVPAMIVTALVLLFTKMSHYQMPTLPSNSEILP